MNGELSARMQELLAALQLEGHLISAAYLQMALDSINGAKGEPDCVARSPRRKRFVGRRDQTNQRLH